MKRMGVITFDIPLVVNNNEVQLDYDKIENDKSINSQAYANAYYKLLEFIFNNTKKEEPIDWADVEGYRRIDAKHFVLKGSAFAIINRDGTYTI